MIHFDDFYYDLNRSHLAPFVEPFKAVIDARYTNRLHGDHPKWQAAFDALPEIAALSSNLDADTVSAILEQALESSARTQLITALMGLHPWRKGPFAIGDVFIDTEWHSDWKWNRVAKHLRPLQGKTVLDVGCGSGYHCWRMAGAGAELVVGVDPSQKFLYQFQALKKYLGAQPVHLLPLRGEDLPKNLSGFDTVFSMGVLYHRKSPFDHLEELKAALRPGGELVLETLVIDGDENDILVPGERYSQMRNVWFIPSAKALSHWLERCGFVDVVVADINQTSIEEQRATDWMTFHSLENFLDPNDNNKTVEGYPAPKRATLIARKPN
ncbi:MAG: tRNA (mo5U34)-methyltransferase [Flavobacteriales bacterium]|jgi:tRNA (mo5U34)-methyltransferase